MNQSRPLKRRPEYVRRNITAAYLWRWPYALLPLGTTALLLFSASFGHGSAPDAAHAQAAQTLPPLVQRFLRQNCLACHNKTTASGGLNLAATSFRPQDANNFALWVKVHDRVADGEMPPKPSPQPAPASRKNFLAGLSKPLIATDEARVKREGRATWRRMNRYEYENTLRDLLDAPWLQIRERLPEDGLAARFNKVGDALDVSHVQMSRYLAAADYALREVMAKQTARPETTTKRYYAREQRSFTGLIRAGMEYTGASARGTFPILDNAADLPALDRNGPMTAGEKDPEKRERESIGVVASSYEPIQPRFNQFRAPVSGRYRLRLRGHTFWAGPLNEKQWWHANQKEISAGRTQEPVSLYASSSAQRLRHLGTVDVEPQSTVSEIEAVLLEGETIMPDAARLFRSRPPNPDNPFARKTNTAWRSPLATQEGQPGVAFQWLEVEGPLLDTWPPRGHRLLFGDLPLKETGSNQVEVVPNDPDKDGARLIREFVQRALRRPMKESDVQPFVKLFQTARGVGANFTDALLAAYSGVLCSPAFVTLEERPGALDDHALASRLSYFLWNSEPDAALRSLADKGALRNPQVLAAQTDRLLADTRSARFVEAFLDYWLDLRKADDTSPDETLYPDYYLDDHLSESAVQEPRAFFAELLHQNLPARNLVASDFVMVNARLADLYGLSGVQGAKIRRVALPKDSVRGGLLTQASVLKVTANGTTTSPVLRGAWITERILGQPVPPPPPSVPAVEPDIRGATTIRELLAKHRAQPSCNSCHAKIDPPGFALESFDVYGGWRDRYRALGEEETVPGFGKNGQPFAFHAAQQVDPSGELPDGRKFSDVRDMKRLLCQNERQIARNLARQLVTYATGAPVGFGDRPKIEAILDRAKPGGYGVKSLLHSIIASELFRNK